MILDVSSRLRPDGLLDLADAGLSDGVPYRIVRLGYTTTGATCRPASPEATGLELVKRTGVVTVHANDERAEAVFEGPGEVVCRFTEGVRSAAATAANFPAAYNLSAGWRVSFSGLGAPEGVFPFETLESWSGHANEGIRYLAGHGVYRRKFTFVPDGRTSVRWLLDLGAVHDIATVRLNGRMQRRLLEAPYRIDVTDDLVAGENMLEVDVVNCWPNRLIGDARVRASGRVPELRSPLGNWPNWVIGDKLRTESPFTWSTYRDAYSASSSLLPAGLLGPVVLRPFVVMPL